MLSSKNYIGFLSAFALLGTSGSLKASDVLNKEPSPLNSTYIPSLLKSVRATQPKITSLPGSESALFGFLPIHLSFSRPLHAGFVLSNEDTSLPYAMSAMAVTPWAMLEGGLDGDTLDGEFRGSLTRGSLTIGNLYQSPFYIRAGFDYLSFGRHISEAIMPQHMVTRKQLSLMKFLMGEIGYSHLNTHSQWHTSFTGFREETAGKLTGGIFKYQYSSDTSAQIGALGTIEHYILGTGFGIGKSNNGWGGLFNLYGDASFQKGVSTRFEYLHDGASKGSQNAFHTEISKQLGKITKWHISSAAVTGIKVSTQSIKSELHSTENLQDSADGVKISSQITSHIQPNIFAAYKLKAWKERIILLGGVEFDMAQLKPSPLIRVGLSL